MKNRKTKKLSTLFLTTLVLIFSLSLGITAGAKTIKNISSGSCVFYIKGHHHTWSFDTGEATSKKAITNLKLTGKAVSKPKVIKYKDSTNPSVEVRIKKPGTFTLSYNAKQPNGDVIKYVRKNYRIKYYKNPISSLKIGKKEYKNMFNNEWYNSIALKKLNNKKITIKMAKGFKLKNIEVYKGGSGDYNCKIIKNSGTLNIKKGCNIQIRYADKDGDENTLMISTN